MNNTMKKKMKIMVNLEYIEPCKIYFNIKETINLTRVTRI